jgi:hypothetical protein
LSIILFMMIAFLVYHVISLAKTPNTIGDSNEPEHTRTQKAALSGERLPKLVTGQKQGELYLMSGLYLLMVQPTTQELNTGAYPFIGIYVSANSWGIRRAGFTVYPTRIKPENKTVLLAPVAIYKQGNTLYADALFAHSATTENSQGIGVQFILDITNNKRTPNRCYTYKDAGRLHRDKTLTLPFAIQEVIDCQDFDFQERR